MNMGEIMEVTAANVRKLKAERDAAVAERDRLASRVAVLQGTIDLAYIPHRSLTEDNDRLRKERDALRAREATLAMRHERETKSADIANDRVRALEAALRKYAVHWDYSLGDPKTCIAGQVLGADCVCGLSAIFESTAETEAKPIDEAAELRAELERRRDDRARS